jgi:hypothetical protein
VIPVKTSRENIDETKQREQKTGGLQMAKISYEAKISSKQLESFFIVEAKEDAD